MYFIDPDGGADHLPKLCDCETECKGLPAPAPTESTAYRSYANVQIVAAILLGLTVSLAGAWYVRRMVEDVSKW